MNALIQNIHWLHKSSSNLWRHHMPTVDYQQEKSKVQVLELKHH